jgi:hypothetical protein
LGDLYKEGNPELSLSSLREGIERLSPVFAAVPAAVSGVMAGLVESYVSHCETIGQEPDGALLAPVREVFQRLNAPGEKIMSSYGDNRSVTAGDIIGSSVVTGDNNVVSTRMTQYTLPPPDTVDVKAELAALRELVSKLNLQDRGKLNRAIEDATEETSKADPDKEEVAGAVGRIVKYAKAADDFDEHVTKLLPHIAALGSWLGTAGYALLKAVGIAP